MCESNGPNRTQGHLEWELSIIGDLAPNNSALTSLLSQRQSWDRFQILNKLSQNVLKIQKH